jgi:GTP-binding protein EngB required for normal cell division
MHHAISKRIHDALEKHKNLKGVYKYRDNRFVTQAIDKAAHNGWQKWHQNMERQVVDWLEQHETATQAQFEKYLRDLYRMDKELAPRFPNGL